MNHALQQQVLVVEDDADIRECMADVLSTAGYSVRTAANGLEGINALRGGYRPCVVLLDLMMPVMNGQEFLVRVRERSEPEIAEIPVVVVTAAGQNVSAPGANALVRKPFEIEALLQAVARQCEPRAASVLASSEPWALPPPPG